MTDYYGAIRACPLFSGMTDGEIAPLLDCLAPIRQSLGKGMAAISAGQRVSHVGIVARGRLEGVRTDHAGRLTLLAVFMPGGVFGEVLSISQSIPSPVDVIAAEPSVALKIAGDKLTGPCAMACPGHIKLIQNLMRLVGAQYFDLHKKLAYLSKKTIRARLAAYLLDNAAAGSAPFDLPLSRQAMADYLCADRSALSRELARMKADGLISYGKNTFAVLDAKRLADMG